MEDMCSNCGFYKIPPLFWSGSTEPLLCDCPKERSYSAEDFKLFARQYYREIKLDKSNLLWDELADKCLEQFKKK